MKRVTSRFSHLLNSLQIMVDEFECVEDYTLIDRRLVLCTLACGFSVFALIYDYLFPFPRSGTVLAACAIRYPSYHVHTHIHTHTHAHTHTHTQGILIARNV